MRINYNISAMIANNSLKRNDDALSNSIERLSSGLKINHAKDNASGLAMAKRMNAQIRSLDQANLNANDGVSVIEIAEGALAEIQDMVQRMSELSIKACNGTMTDDDRKSINEEISQLKSEIVRVSESTMYNGSVLLNGNFDLKGYSDNLDVKVTTYGDDVRAGSYVIDDLNITKNADGEYVLGSYSFGDGFPVGTEAYMKDDALYITGNNGFEVELQIKDAVSGPVNLDITGLGALNVQIGTAEGQELGVRIAAINLRSLGIENYDCSTQENSQEFLSAITDSLKYVSEARSRLGAYQNRFEHTISTLDISEENMTGAYSRIMDVDMAEEMTLYSTNQVLMQAGTNMLAQANDRPSSVLQLLQQ